MSLFSKRLKEIRVASQITQKEVALFLEMTPNAYQKYEYDRREPPYDTLIKLCNYFNVSSDYLLGLSDDPTRH